VSAAGSTTAGASLRVAYLVNRYPSPSHSFIRREIQALEQHGDVVQRFSIRAGQVENAEGADAGERERTAVLLPRGAGWLAAFAGCAATWLASPRRAFTALRTTLRLGLASDRGALRHLAYFVEATLLRRRLAPDTQWLHAHFGTNSAFVAMLCEQLGGPPWSFTVHGPEEFERAAGIGLRDKVAAARFVAVISDYCRSQVWQVARHADWPKAVTVRCGLDAAFLAPPRVPAPAAPELLWVGRLAPAKGIPVLLDACAALRARGVAFRLTLVGGGELESWVRDRLRADGLVDHVVLAGWRTAEQIRDLLDRARGLVVASFAEGLPVVIMEAMARERPVVATRIAAIPELVETGVTGWLVPPARADALADAMNALLQSTTTELARLGSAGRERIERLHRAVSEAATLRGAIVARLPMSPR
jgi:colanic acid/amylovoran biosynthesis glycosyltransferase